MGDKRCGVAPGQAVLSWEAWPEGRAAPVAQSVFIDGSAQSRRRRSRSTASFRGCVPWHSLSYNDFILHSLHLCRRFFVFFLTFVVVGGFSFFLKAYVATSTILATIDRFILLVALPCWNTQCEVPQHSSAFVCKAECLAQRNVSASLHSPLGLACCKALQS